MLGQALGASFSAGTSLTQQAQSTTTLTVLGKNLNALQTQVGVTDDPDGTAYMEVYSFGLRVFSQNAYFSNDGILGFNAGLLPTEVRVPFIVYPVGPLTLEIDGGGRFQATASAQASPTLVIGATSLSSVDLSLQAQASAAGFIQGYAELFMIRGGVGGDVNLVDANADLQAVFRFDGSPPDTSVSAEADFLNGSLYGFADFFDIFFMSWTRFWTDTLYSWKGFCFAAGSASCASQ